MPVPHPLAERLHHLSDELIELECDGFSRVASYLLTTYGIPHQVHCGSLKVSHEGTVSAIAFHCWIVAGEHLIDFRVGMWMIFQNVNVIPHGVFLPTEFPAAHYEGEPAGGNWADPSTYQILLLTGKTYA